LNELVLDIAIIWLIGCVASTSRKHAAKRQTFGSRSGGLWKMELWH